METRFFTCPEEYIVKKIEGAYYLEGDFKLEDPESQTTNTISFLVRIALDNSTPCITTTLPKIYEFTSVKKELMEIISKIQIEPYAQQVVKDIQSLCTLQLHKTEIIKLHVQNRQHRYIAFFQLVGLAYKFAVEFMERKIIEITLIGGSERPDLLVDELFDREAIVKYFFAQSQHRLRLMFQT